MGVNLRTEFLPHKAVANFVALMSKKVPEVFDSSRIGPVGVDIPAQRVETSDGRTLQPTDGRWDLEHGDYIVYFGFAFPKFLEQEEITPEMFGRSSNFRCGAAFSSFAALDRDGGEQTPLFGGEVIGNYHVYNEQRIQIDDSAGIAQVCLTRNGESQATISESLKPAEVFEFVGSGIIGKKRTHTPKLQEVPFNDGRWDLQQDHPYLVIFDGIAALSLTEVLVPSAHYADLVRHPKELFLEQRSCLGDSGFVGELRRVVVPRGRPVTLTPNDGIGRVQKHRVTPTLEVSRYDGQWQYQGIKHRKRLIEFRDLTKWPDLIGAVMPALEELVKQA